MADKKPPLKRWERMLSQPYFWVIFVLFGVGLPLIRGIMRPQPEALADLGQLPAFEMINQENEKVTLDSYRGSVWVSNFIFTSCPDTCPLLTQQMAKVQKRFRQSYPLVKLASISVDPHTDTPAVLKKYAEKYKPNFRQWSFLTGSTDVIENVVVNGFKMALDKAAPEKQSANSLMSITHGEHFVIVDQVGRIRAYRRAANEQDINKIVADVAILLNTDPSKPIKPAAR